MLVYKEIFVICLHAQIFVIDKYLKKKARDKCLLIKKYLELVFFNIFHIKMKIIIYTNYTIIRVIIVIGKKKE